MAYSWESKYAEQMRDIIYYGKLLYSRGLISAAGGNISARCGEYMLISGSNVPMGELNKENLVLCDMQGRKLEGVEGLKPSKETPFHIRMYREHPEIKAVIHAHPNYSILWSLQGKPLPLYTESAKLKLGDVPIVPDGIPGSLELADNVLETDRRSGGSARAFLMEAHGILTMGESMRECFNTAELLEDSAKIAVYQALLSK